jgi:murein DD-endopeptidase MepM/ murein hydrolase activator NlpD
MRSRALLRAAAAVGAACLVGGGFVAAAGSALRDDVPPTVPTTTAVEPAPPVTTAVLPATTTAATTTTVAQPPPTSTTAPADPTPRLSLPPLAGTYDAPEPEAPRSAGVPATVSGFYHLGGHVRGPLTTQPPLAGGPYVFPVAGDVSWGDTYGADRSDVPGGWHHGADIFARLGQPVLAVAAGKVYSVGWQRLGGWRLWLRDSEGNRFYYAHLSGYTELGQNEHRVQAGDVIGFIGHTGDAFTTLWHLHFEIHPAALLRLRYDGAVDPSAYLASWERRTPSHVPKPAPLPVGAATHGEGAVSDYRRLLALRAPPTRALAAPAPRLLARLPRRPEARVVTAAAAGNSQWLVAAVAAAAALAAATASTALRARRRRSTDAP